MLQSIDKIVMMVSASPPFALGREVIEGAGKGMISMVCWVITGGLVYGRSCMMSNLRLEQARLDLVVFGSLSGVQFT